VAVVSDRTCEARLRGQTDADPLCSSAVRGDNVFSIYAATGTFAIKGKCKK
jgi:hypothetical protein